MENSKLKVKIFHFNQENSIKELLSNYPEQFRLPIRNMTWSVQLTDSGQTMRDYFLEKEVTDWIEKNATGDVIFCYRRYGFELLPEPLFLFEKNEDFLHFTLKWLS